MDSVVYNEELSQLNHTIGVVFIGYVVTMVLYGFTSYQAYIYFTNLTEENIWKKLTIGSLTILDTTSVGTLTQVLHFYLIEEYARSSPAVVVVTKEFASDHTLGIAMIFIAQLAYAYRIRLRNIPVAIIAAIFATVSFAFGLTMTIKMSGNDFDNFDHGLIKTSFALCQGTAFIAGLITFFMLFFYDPSPKISSPAVCPPMWYDEPIEILIDKGGFGILVLLGYFIVFMAFPSNRYWISFELVARRAFSLGLVTFYINRATAEGRTVMSPVNTHKSTVSHFGSGFRNVTMTSQSGITSQHGFTGDNYEVSDSHKILPITITTNRETTRDDDYALWSKPEEGIKQA